MSRKEENEVDPYGEGSVVGDEVVWMVDGSVIFESWIVVGVMAMSMDVDDEEQERLGSRHGCGPELQVQWVSLSVQVEALVWVVPV